MSQPQALYTNCETFIKPTELLNETFEFIRKNKTTEIANVASVFDIEATSFYKDDLKQACMYAWVFGINGKCVRGRTWGEFLDLLDEIIKHYNISINKRLIVYIHNLSYEFQWFKDYFEWHNIFSLDNRKPVYAITKNGIEFRCSYILSGYSLEKLGENLLKYKVKKMVGDLDYRLMRHSQTPITEKEWGYILNDGLVVMSHIQEEIERLGDITKIPLTNTGYVRELCKNNCLKGTGRYNYVSVMKTLTMSVDNYHQLKRAYMGGFTHANVEYVDRVISNVSSYDFTSSYPAVMVSEKFPMSPPFKVDITSEEMLKDYINAFCCMFDVKFYNIRSIVPYEDYISYSRCTEIEGFLLDNGRVVEAEILKTTITEQDFFTISEMYDWDKMEISNFNAFYANYLPKELIMTILELYKDKTTLKGVEGKEAEYMNAKSMINSVYGMCVTDPCKDDIMYEDKTWLIKDADIDTLINKYNSNRQRFLYYPWGVWVTAYARRNLFTGIKEFAMDYIYSDTDSIKVINADKHQEYIEKYNAEITRKIEKCLNHYKIPKDYARPKTIKGVEKPLGVWDYEGTYNRFKTLGAKRYITETDGEIDITIAGVNKKAGKKYLQHTFKNNTSIFKHFQEDLNFPAIYDCNGVEENGSGKLLHTYIDIKMSGELIDYMGNKGVYQELSGIHMENTDYTMSLDAGFVKLFMGIKEGHLC